MATVPIWVVISDVTRENRWRRLLSQGGWKVHCSRLADIARSHAGEVHLALVDADSLGTRAAAAVQNLRAFQPNVSLILTSPLPLHNDKLVGFIEAGCDDYLPENADVHLITAKLASHLRRILFNLADSSDTLETSIGDLRLNLANGEAQVKNKKGQWQALPRLTPTEFRLVRMFLEHPGIVLERQYLLGSLESSQQEDKMARPATVDKHVESLRKKLGSMGSRIKTIYKAGYIFETEG